MTDSRMTLKLAVAANLLLHSDNAACVQNEGNEAETGVERNRPPCRRASQMGSVWEKTEGEEEAEAEEAEIPSPQSLKLLVLNGKWETIEVPSFVPGAEVPS